MGDTFRVACVTGGAGFIGSHLVRALLTRGLEVKVLDNLSVGRRANVPNGAVLVEGDIADEECAKRAMEGCDIVFHLAARVAIRSSFESPSRRMKTRRHCQSPPRVETRKRPKSECRLRWRFTRR